MKYQLLILTSLLLCLETQAQQGKPFTLSGTVKGMPAGKIYLGYQADEEKHRIDSADLQNGRFVFKGVLPGPVAGTLYHNRRLIMDAMADISNIFLEPGDMTITLEKGRFREARLLGSAAQAELDELEINRAAVEKELRPHSIAHAQVAERYRAAVKAKKEKAVLESMKDSLQKIQDQMEPYYAALDKIDNAFINTHPDSYVTAYLLRYRVNSMPLNEGEAMYKRMSPALQQSIYGKGIRKDLDGLRNGSPGSIAHPFSKQDISGQPLNLESFRGKYVLLDFWASWCGPCRKGNPHLKTLYAKYKNKGLEIIGISDDDSKPAAWKEAVDKDGIGIWKHVLRGLDWNKRNKGLPNPEDISDYYGIHSLPTKILIDKEGKIIGRYGGAGENDEAMDRKLSEIFGG